jgi:c-di-GMP-binding flagellar brake protein YcgR
MSELTREFAAQLRRFIGDRRHARRRQVRLPFSICLLDQCINCNGSRRPETLEGHTMDVSDTGMGLVVPFIRIGDHYLAGEHRKLEIKIELPGGPVEVQGFPVRYESLDEHRTESGYLIGVRITQMSDRHRSQLTNYINKIGKRPSRVDSEEQ